MELGNALTDGQVEGKEVGRAMPTDECGNNVSGSRLKTVIGGNY